MTSEDEQLLYSARSNTSTYSSGIDIRGCGVNLLSVKTKSSASASASYDFKLQAATDYHFTVQGFTLDGDEAQFVGQCDEDMGCDVSTTFEIYITSEPNSNELKVTKISAKKDGGDLNGELAVSGDEA
ncbi:hypothetical protein P3T76_011902 [Phytophthora citrophthora]|uniref:Uncharacterized protein n=1 Tax=Phytophthora citrophthora TaxID=4793 RepID=A0AAD9G8C4_9STRA|nr:hypothetical protein P3T76_011902 [Phytophthora citrophthora]